MTTVTSPSNLEYIRDVADIDLQEYKGVENIAFYQVQTNLGSGLSMESERSLRIHICTDRNGVNFLLEFLHHLVESKESYRNVTNLLFHCIEWHPEEIRLLCSYLGSGSNVKQSGSHWSDIACLSFGKQQMRGRVSGMGRLNWFQGIRRTLQDD